MPARRRARPRAKKTAKGGKAKAAPKKEAKAGKKAKPAHAKEASTPRAESKGAKILELIGRPKGATLAEIVKATDWQKHSIRGFLSTAAKKHGLKIESTKTEAGDRVYQIKNRDSGSRSEQRPPLARVWLFHLLRTTRPRSGAVAKHFRIRSRSLSSCANLR